MEKYTVGSLHEKVTAVSRYIHWNSLLFQGLERGLLGIGPTKLRSWKPEFHDKETRFNWLRSQRISITSPWGDAADSCLTRTRSFGQTLASGSSVIDIVGAAVWVAMARNSVSAAGSEREGIFAIFLHCALGVGDQFEWTVCFLSATPKGVYSVYGFKKTWIHLLFPK